MGRAGAIQEFNQMPQVVVRHVTELLGGAGQHRCIEVLEKLRTGVGQRDLDDPAVVVAPLAAHESARFELVDEPRHVGRSRNELSSEGERGHTPRRGGTEQAERVILLGGKLMTLKQLILERFEFVVRSPQIEEGLLLKRIEAR